MVKEIAAEKARAGLWHAVVYPNVAGRTKGKIAQSKNASPGSFAMVDKAQVARICLWCYFVFLFCFASFSCVSLSMNPRPFAQSFVDMHAYGQLHAVN